MGAAALVDDGRVVAGCNVENASYGVALCAECGLVSQLHLTGGGRLTHFVCVNGRSEVIMPCGRCRQLLIENGGPELLLLTAPAYAGWTRCCRMPSAPTTSIDLTAADVVADPYPHFAAERAGTRWPGTSRAEWLTFSHAAAGAVLRNRRLGRIWRDREPAAYLEPFNLLHRNQMMENEPPEHTRLRRAVAGAFNRGHVERLRPRVQSLAASLLDEVDPAAFDVIGEYAEPLPVLVIAELIGLATPTCPRCGAGRRRSCGCTSRRRPQEVVDAAVRRGAASSPTWCASTSTGGASSRETT